LPTTAVTAIVAAAIDQPPRLFGDSKNSSHRSPKALKATPMTISPPNVATRTIEPHTARSTILDSQLGVAVVCPSAPVLSAA
jgi:hypothetical protein